MLALKAAVDVAVAVAVVVVVVAAVVAVVDIDSDVSSWQNHATSPAEFKCISLFCLELIFST